MKARISPRWAVCLCLLPLLGGCGLLHRQVLVRPQVIEVPVTRYVPVPVALTAPIPEPAPPPKHCTWHGVPAVCVLDGLAWIEQLRGQLDKANDDRARAAELGNTNAQPATH